MTTKFKYIIFSIIPLLVIFLAAEVFFRWTYFSKKEKRTFACVYNFELWKNKAQKLRARMDRERSENELKEASQKISDLIDVDVSNDREAREKCVQGLYRSEGAALLGKFKEAYEKSFESFSKEVNESGAVLLVTYFPSGRPTVEQEACRAFYQSISEKGKIPFFDMTRVLEKYSQDYYLLLPDNAHLSRFGNQLIADEFKKVISSFKIKANVKSYENRPALLGDLPPGTSQILEPQQGLVYREIVNSQGLRHDGEVRFPKTKSRVLCVGDSFTYGPYLHEWFSYPGLLQRYLPAFEIINAGVSGYHIGDELAYYQERGRFVEADIVILQVLDNDLPGQFFFYQNLFSRSKAKFLPCAEEVDFFKKIKWSFK